LSASIKTFDHKGKAISIEESHMEEHRIKPFQPVATYNGVDLKASLAAFLEAKGMFDRIPRGSTPQAAVSQAPTESAQWHRPARQSQTIKQYQPYQRTPEESF
jgi:hypothetical protein